MNKRYAIVGAYTKKIIGYTSSEGILDVLSEETDNTRFIELTNAEWKSFDQWESDENGTIYRAVMSRERLRAEVVKTVRLIKH